MPSLLQSVVLAAETRTAQRIADFELQDEDFLRWTFVWNDLVRVSEAERMGNMLGAVPKVGR